MDDLEEFFALVGTAEITYDICENPHWAHGVEGGCPIVVADGNCTRTKAGCHHCKKRFIVCDCGKGMKHHENTLVCVYLGDIKCPRVNIDEDEP